MVTEAFFIWLLSYDEKKINIFKDSVDADMKTPHMLLPHVKIFFRALRKQYFFVRDCISRGHMDVIVKDIQLGFWFNTELTKNKMIFVFFVRNRVRIIHQYKYLWERRLKGGDVDDFKHKMNLPSSLEGGGRAWESVDFISTILFKRL